jgi:hypothetical protein
LLSPEREVTMRRTALLLAVFVVTAGWVAADVGVRLHVRVAPRIWIGANWHLGPSWVMAGANPNLAVVDTNIHPKHTRLYLDGRFIGLADDFDGYPGFLFLKPGRYQLECQLGGYRTEVVKIEAEAGYRYDTRFRMERLKGTQKEHWWERPDRPKPLNRLYGPKGAPPVGKPEGPDPSLRPDLEATTTPRHGQEAVRERTGSLLLEVVQPEAAIYLDGEFLATGRELAALGHAIAVEPGKHRVEAMAPGMRRLSREVEVETGKTVVLKLDLGSRQAGSADL